MEETIELLYNEVKSKKQIKDLDNEFVKKHIIKYLKSNGDMRKKIENSKNKTTKNPIIKTAIKDIRNEIGQLYGCYLTSKYQKRYRFLEENKIEELLLSHKSSRERYNFYNEFYNIILNWHKPKSIVDIACGFNPFSYPILEKKHKKIKYLTIDLDNDDTNLINNFFEKNKLNGKAKTYDITDKKFLQDKDLKNYETAFLLKTLDSVERTNKNLSKEILEDLPQKKIVVTFPSQSLVSKKNVKNNARKWFIKFLDEKKWNYIKTSIENEDIYLITKN